jgi:hypothetical protein
MKCVTQDVMNNCVIPNALVKRLKYALYKETDDGDE